MILISIIRRSKGKRRIMKQIPSSDTQHFSRKIEGFHQTARGSDPFVRDIESGSMIHRCPDHFEPQCYIDTPLKIQKFQRNMPLIMIHADNCIVYFPVCLQKNRIWRDGAFHVHTFTLGYLDSGLNLPYFLLSE